MKSGVLERVNISCFTCGIRHDLTKRICLYESDCLVDLTIMLSYDVWLKQITIPADMGDVPKPEDQPADRFMTIYQK